MGIKIGKLIKGPAITAREDDELALAREMMAWGDVRHLPVMGGDAIVGVLSERDLLRRYSAAGRAAAKETVGSAMSSPPVTITPHDDVDAAIRLITERGIGCLPVVEGNRVVGIVTRRDLLTQQIDDRAAEQGDGFDREVEPRAGWTGLLVDAAMSREPLTAAADDSLRIAIDRMGRHGIRHLPVVDGERRVIGLLSDRDVRTVIGNPLRAAASAPVEHLIEDTRVAAAMTREPITLRAGTRLTRAAGVFADHKLGVIPIVDDQERLVGVLSYTDVLRAVLGPKHGAS
jgi:CBS domain-containing protein